jgi:hypothetical protein
VSTGKFANSKDLDKEAEAVVWSDNPETTYLKQMTVESGMGRVADGKDLGDSIIGVNTSSDVMQGNVAEADTASHLENCSLPSMAIVGLEDDLSLSTIANDTVDGNMVGYSLEAPLNPTPKQRDFNEYFTKKSPAGDSDEDTLPVTPPGCPAGDSDEETLPETPPGLMIRVPTNKNTKGSKPKQRDFKEYTTPTKKKNPAGDSDEETLPETPPPKSPAGGSDEDTLPVTPPGLISRVPSGKKTMGSARVKTFDPKPSEGYVAPEGRRATRIFIMASVLGMVLIASIGGLAIALIRLREEDSTTTSANKGLGEITPVPTQQETPVPTQQEIPVPTQQEITVAPSSAPAQRSASPVQGTSTRDDLFQVLSELAPGSLELLEDIETPQYRAFSWLSSDPNYFDYDDSILIQRWVLAIFSLSFEEGGDLSPFSARRLDTSAPGSSVLTDWMSYSDECFWHSTLSDGFCNEEGLVRNIDIRDGGLSGTLPKEVALLSNSLGK